MAHVTRCPYCGSVWLLPDAKTAQSGPVKCAECHHNFDATCDLLEVPDDMFSEQDYRELTQEESYPKSALARDSSVTDSEPRILTPPVIPPQPAQPFIQPAVPATQPVAAAETAGTAGQQPQSPGAGSTTPPPIRPVPDENRKDPSLGDLGSLKKAVGGLPDKTVPQPAEPPQTMQRPIAARPDFDRPRMQRHESSGHSGLSIPLLILLLILTAAVAAVVFNQKIIRKVPQSDQLFSRVCRTVPCPGYCFEDIEAFSVTRSTLRALDAEHQYLLEATLTNTSSVEQKLPNLKVAFLDGAGEALLRRTVSPEEYLEAPTSGKRQKGLPAGKALTVRFTLTSSVAPSRSVVTPSYDEVKSIPEPSAKSEQ